MLNLDLAGSRQSLRSDYWPRRFPGHSAPLRPRRPARPAPTMLSDSAATPCPTLPGQRRASQETGLTSVRCAGRPSRMSAPGAIVVGIAERERAEQPSRRFRKRTRANSTAPAAASLKRCLTLRRRRRGGRAVRGCVPLPPAYWRARWRGRMPPAPRRSGRAEAERRRARHENRNSH